ncbi:MAG: hypothetical protein HS129_03865 [Leptospiraceae bacterium]|nr:hypothetical protein [Leptospiraceae bacterium]NUM41488.1 hypothetical protein [Leptospiraceae bacterium]
MMKILLFLVFFYYSWKVIRNFLFENANREEKEKYSQRNSPFSRQIEKDVTNRARVIRED